MIFQAELSDGMERAEAAWNASIGRLKAYLSEYDRGCSNTQVPPTGPENCPECVKAFVDAIRKLAEPVSPPAEHVHEWMDITTHGDSAVITYLTHKQAVRHD
jgi:hypothetical protein